MQHRAHLNVENETFKKHVKEREEQTFQHFRLFFFYSSSSVHAQTHPHTLTQCRSQIEVEAQTHELSSCVCLSTGTRPNQFEFYPK